MHLGKRLKLARKNKGYSQAELASASGVKQQMISKLETEKSSATSDILHLAQALGISAEWLGGVAEEPESYTPLQLNPLESSSLNSEITRQIFSFLKVEFSETFQQLSAQEQNRIFTVCYYILHKQNHLSEKAAFSALREALKKSI